MVDKLDSIRIGTYKLRENLLKYHRRQPLGLNIIDSHVNKYEAFGNKGEKYDASVLVEGMNKRKLGEVQHVRKGGDVLN